MVSTRAASRGGRPVFSARTRSPGCGAAQVRDRQLAPLLLLDRPQPMAGPFLVNDAEHQLAALQQFLHRMGDQAALALLGARQHAVADAERAILAAPLHHPKPRRRPFRLPALRHRPGAAAVVDVDDAKHRHLGHAAHLVERAPGRGIDQPFVGHVAQQRLERDLLIALEPERPRDLALAGRIVRRLDEVEDLLLRLRQAAVCDRFLRHPKSYRLRRRAAAAHKARTHRPAPRMQPGFPTRPRATDETPNTQSSTRTCGRTCRQGPSRCSRGSAELLGEARARRHPALCSQFAASVRRQRTT